MKVFQIKVYIIHDLPDFHQLMLGFLGRDKYRSIYNINRSLADENNMLYADVDRTVFTFQELDRLRHLFAEYADSKRVGLIGYTIHDIELPELAVGVFASYP